MIHPNGLLNLILGGGNLLLTKNFPNRKKLRKELADQRNEDRSKRSDAEQLEILKLRGHGNCKEALKLIELKV